MLADVASGSVSVEEAFERLRALPYEKVAGAHVDHHRGIRQGVPEVIFGEGKTTEQIVTIARSMRKAGTGVLITRLSDEKMRALRKRLRGSQSHPKARCMVVRDGVPKILGKGTVLVVTAGTSDIPVAEEAAVTAEFLGNRVDRLFDVGVAGIHRILLQQDRLRGARVIVVAAGMEGAASHCEELWDALFACRPPERLSSPAAGQNHVMVPAEFERFWHQVMKAQGEGDPEFAETSMAANGNLRPRTAVEPDASVGSTPDRLKAFFNKNGLQFQVEGSPRALADFLRSFGSE